MRPRSSGIGPNNSFNVEGVDSIIRQNLGALREPSRIFPMHLSRLLLLLTIWCNFSGIVLGDAGVLIPSSDSNAPDPSKLSLEDMQVQVLY